MKLCGSLKIVINLLVIVPNCWGQDSVVDVNINKNGAKILNSNSTTVTLAQDDKNAETNFTTVELESRFGGGTKKTSKKSKKECILDLTNPDYEKYLPIPIYKDALGMYQEILPQKGVIRLAVGEEIKMVCAGSRNKLKLAPRTSIHSPTCVKDTTLKLGNKNQNITKFECSYIVKGDVQNTKTACGHRKGNYFEIGHKITREDFVKLIGVCYDEEQQIPLYTEHTIYGTEIQYASKSNYRPSFSTEGLRTTSKYNPQIAYKIESQQKQFQNEFGLDIITDSMFLARGHLAPDSDFILATSQYSTFFFLNVAPMWQTINNRNWKSLENTIRTYSKTFPELKIITGIHDQLNFKDGNNNEVLVFMTGKEIPVPKYFWKIVSDPTSQRAIVFIVFNNPFLNKEPANLFCEDICASAGWLNPQWKKMASGYLFCCDFKQFKKVVDTVPKINVKGVLGGNNY